MIPEVEKPRVTEILVRMDCNGCVQKIKRALHGINGIYDLYIDFPQQKLTIIGWADPEKILKAIRKTRKIATICSHTEPEPATQPTEQPPDGGAEPLPAPEASNSPPAEPPPDAEPPKDQSPPPENPPPETAQAPSLSPSPSPSPIANDTNAAQPTQPTGPEDVGKVHVIYHHPPTDYGYRYGYSHGFVRPWNKYSSGQALPPESSQPLHVTHGYNTYRPSPYVTEYEYTRSPPRYTNYSRRDHYDEDYHSSSSSSNGNITSMFSDENPNACTIV